MQTLWMAFDNFAGKGIGIVFILKFLWYITLLVAPMAFPIGILLSSIMTLGNLAENYEFASIKSAGVSLQRMIRPLIIFAFLMSVINFGFYNYVYPYAMLKQLNLKLNVKKKQPALALIPGSFNTEIPDYQIKFDEKYGKEDNLLKNVLIYDLSSNKGNNKIISAKEGELLTEEGSRYMTLVLKNGHFFEHHENNNTPYEQRERMPASYANFEEYTINIDISSFSNDDLDNLEHTRNYNMLSLNQLKDTIPDIKQHYDEYIVTRAKNLFVNVDAEKLYKYPDSLIDKELSSKTLSNFDLEEQNNILSTAVSKIDRTLNNVQSNKEMFKYKRKVLNLYDIEFYNRIALSLSCVLLFFVGAPLGSIIKKGGMGMPMIFAILVYVTFHFSNTFGRNMAEESSLTAATGSWLSIFLMLPLAVVLTVRAANDKGMFDFRLRQLIARLSKKKTIYFYNTKVSNEVLTKIREKFKDLDENQIVKFVQNYIQYNFSKEERQAGILILKERGVDVNEVEKLENKKYLEALNKFSEYKTSILISIPIWVITLVIPPYSVGIVLKVVMILVFIIFLKTAKEILDELDALMNNQIKKYTNPFLFYTLGLSLSIVVYYFTNKEIKEKLKSFT